MPIEEALSDYFEPSPSLQQTIDTLRQVMALLLRQPSGYGREQLLMEALRLACREQRGPGVPADDLVLDYLLMAEVLLKGEADA